MSHDFGLDSLTNSLATLTPLHVKGLEGDLIKLLQKGGGFANSAKVIQALRAALSSAAVSISELERLSLDDPLLALRLLAESNSAFYRRASANETLNASLSTIGLRHVPELLSSLSEPKNYSTWFVGRSIFSAFYQECLIAALLAKGIIQLLVGRPGLEERAYLCSALSNGGILALAFYRPNLYSACVLESWRDDQTSVEGSFRKIFAKSKYELASTIAEALALPESFRIPLKICEANPWKNRVISSDSKDNSAVAGAVFFSNKIAAAICRFHGVQDLESALKETLQRLSLNRAALYTEVVGLAETYPEACDKLGLPALPLPDYLSTLNTGQRRTSTSRRAPLPRKSIADRLNSFLHEIRACFKTAFSSAEFMRLPQAVVCTCEGLIKGHNFTRVMLLRYDPDRNSLVPLFLHGESCVEFKYLLRSTTNGLTEDMPDVRACLEKKVVFNGEPVFRDGWPFVAFPIVAGGEVQAVFYADRRRNAEDMVPLDAQEQVACVALAEGWNEVPPTFG